MHETPLSFRPAVVVYPQADEARCEAALVLDVDPIKLVRGNAKTVAEYVKDHPSVASSFLSFAVGRVLRTAMRGASRERPELAGRAIPLEAEFTTGARRRCFRSALTCMAHVEVT